MDIIQRLFLVALGLPEVIALFLAARKTQSPYLWFAFIRAALFTLAYVFLVLFGVETMRDTVRVMFVLMSAISGIGSIIYIQESRKK